MISTVRFDTLVAGTDLTPLGDLAARGAVELASRVGASRAHLVHVVSPSQVPHSPTLPESAQLRSIRTLEKEAVAVAKRNLDALEVPHPLAVQITREVRLGAPVRELLQAVRDTKAQMIIASTHGRSALGRLLMGSVAGNLIRTAPCPALVLGEDRPLSRPFRTVMAAIDLSAVSEKVIAHALSLAFTARGKVDIVTFFHLPLPAMVEGLPLPLSTIDRADPMNIETQIRALLDRVGVPPGVEVEIHVRQGVPSRGILDLAVQKPPELIAVGTSGHGALHRALIGSTATKVLSEAPCPVLVVPWGAPVDLAGAPP